MTPKPGIPLTEPQTDPSECPICGDWRDSPTADCANCGWAIRPCGDVLGLCAYAGPHDGPHKIAGSWKQRLEREARGIPLIDVELRDLIEKVGARHWDVDWNSPHLILRSDGSGRLMAKGFEPYAAEFIVAAARFVARLASESSIPVEDAVHIGFDPGHPDGDWTPGGSAGLPVEEGDR